MLNKFDRLNLEFDPICFEYINFDMFKKVIDEDGGLSTYIYTQEQPFYLKVNIHIKSQKAYLEFSGKALLDFYPELISEETFTECIENINDLGVFYVNGPDLINTAVVRGCDVTKDILSTYTVSDLYDKLILNNNRRNNITNIDQFKTRFSIKNTVTEKRRKECLTIYDKDYEINLSKNRPFLSAVSNPEEILDYFSHRIRFELNLNSYNRIRKYFNIDEKEQPSLKTLFNYNEDVILKFLYQNITQEVSLNRLKNNIMEVPLKMQTLLRLIFMVLCGFDMPLIEKEVRELYGPSASVTRITRPFKEIMNNLNTCIKSDINGLQEVKSLKSKIEELIMTTLPVSEENNFESVYTFYMNNAYNECIAEQTTNCERIIDEVGCF